MEIAKQGKGFDLGASIRDLAEVDTQLLADELLHHASDRGSPWETHGRLV